jgi:hypothetical protein
LRVPSGSPGRIRTYNLPVTRNLSISRKRGLSLHHIVIPAISTNHNVGGGRSDPSGKNHRGTGCNHLVSEPSSWVSIVKVVSKKLGCGLPCPPFKKMIGLGFPQFTHYSSRHFWRKLHGDQNGFLYGNWRKPICTYPTPPLCDSKNASVLFGTNRNPSLSHPNDEIPKL